VRAEEVVKERKVEEEERDWKEKKEEETRRRKKRRGQWRWGWENRRLGAYNRRWTPLLRLFRIKRYRIQQHQSPSHRHDHHHRAAIREACGKAEDRDTVAASTTMNAIVTTTAASADKST